jgi:hypothetical protein
MNVAAEDSETEAQMLIEEMGADPSGCRPWQLQPGPVMANWTGKASAAAVAFSSGCRDSGRTRAGDDPGSSGRPCRGWPAAS